jgi:hypothetical protein
MSARPMRGAAARTCGAELMHVKLEVIYKNNKPYGIRDLSGFLFFFPQVTKYNGQEDRYRDEIVEQFKLADFLLCALRCRAVEEEKFNSAHSTTKCADEVLKFIHYSSDSVHGRKIIDIIKRHFAYPRTHFDGRCDSKLDKE